MSTHEYRYRTHEQAITHLTERYAEQCTRWPIMRRDIPLRRYLAANTRYAMRYCEPLA